MNLIDGNPLVSVIIPTYNYAAFLPKAINSVLNQTYKNFEIIIIDDGSDDETFSVIETSDTIKYFYQENKGLAAARNAGIKKSKGDYLIFLDADDWLEPNAIECNLAVITGKPHIAFVSGNHYFYRVETGKIHEVAVTVSGKHYMRLLQNNYIGMHAAVLFQRWVFNEFRYDENLKACEDYDLYLNITRKYPVLHHDKFIATYYFHNSGLSHNYQAMIDSINAVMKKQELHIQTADEQAAYAEGLQQWKDYYLLMQKTANLVKEINQ